MGKFSYILILLVILYSIISCLIEYRRCKKFLSGLAVGAKLTTTTYLYGDEFDEGVKITITIIKVDKGQVRVRFDNGRESTIDKMELYIEHWKFC